MKSPYRARGGQREETERVKFLKCGGDALPCQLAGTQVPGGQVLLATLPGGRSGAAGTSPWRDPAAWGAAGMQKPVGNMANCHQLLLAKRHFLRGEDVSVEKCCQKTERSGDREQRGPREACLAAAFWDPSPPPRPRWERRGWPAGRVPASGPRAGQTGVAPSLTLPLDRRPDRCEQPRYAEGLRTAPRCNQQTLYLRDF